MKSTHTVEGNFKRLILVNDWVSTAFNGQKLFLDLKLKVFICCIWWFCEILIIGYVNIHRLTFLFLGILSFFSYSYNSLISIICNIIGFIIIMIFCLLFTFVVSSSFRLKWWRFLSYWLYFTNCMILSNFNLAFFNRTTLVKKWTTSSKAILEFLKS